MPNAPRVMSPTAALTLVLEASTGSASLALLRGAEVVADADVPMRGAEGDRLMPALVQLLATAGVSTVELGRIACSGGPGGFTSLRIAAAIGKGLAESLGVPLWAVSSLALLAAGSAVEPSADGAPDKADARVVAILDAQRGEWYAQRFARTADGGLVAVASAALLDHAAIEGLARGGERPVGVGGGRFTGGVDALPHARDVARLAPGVHWHPIDLARWEPDYGRLAEAQVTWERAHGRPLGSVR